MKSNPPGLMSFTQPESKAFSLDTSHTFEDSICGFKLHISLLIQNKIMLKFLCRSTLHVSDCFKAQHCAVLAKCYVFWFWCLKKKVCAQEMTMRTWSF